MSNATILNIHKGLKPCPFCGSFMIHVNHLEIGNRIWYRATCTEDECGAMGAPRLHRADAERAWNGRTDHPTTHE